MNIETKMMPTIFRFARFHMRSKLFNVFVDLTTKYPTIATFILLPGSIDAIFKKAIVNWIIRSQVTLKKNRN